MPHQLTVPSDSEELSRTQTFTHNRFQKAHELKPVFNNVLGLTKTGFKIYVQAAGYNSLLVIRKHKFKTFKKVGPVFSALKSTVVQYFSNLFT